MNGYYSDFIINKQRNYHNRNLLTYDNFNCHYRILDRYTSTLKKKGRVLNENKINNGWANSESITRQCEDKWREHCIDNLVGFPQEGT